MSYTLFLFQADSQCDVRYSDRLDCGWPGIQEDQCVAWGTGRPVRGLGYRKTSAWPGIQEDQCVAWDTGRPVRGLGMLLGL